MPYVRLGKPYLKGMYVCSDGLNVVPLNNSLLMVAPEKSDLCALSRGQNELGRPVGEALLLGVDQLVKRATGLAEPVLFSVLVGVAVAISALLDLLEIADTLAKDVSGHVCHGAVS